MHAWSSARFEISLPPGHRFPMSKYARIRDAVLERGLLTAAQLDEPEPIPRTTLRLVHHDCYVEDILQGTLALPAQRRLGFPWGPGLRERSLRTAQATVDAAAYALEHGAGINLAGGTHHAFADRGEGFCVFNDVALAIRLLQHEGRLRRALIIDLDVHQGNGTARIFGDDPDVFTFSMHGANNFPFHKELSRLDIELPDGCSDAGYLGALDRTFEQVLQQSAAELVFYLAGADPYHDDRFGRLGLSREGLRERDRRIFTACRHRNLPLVLTLAGGYARNLDDVIEIQSTTVSECLEAYG